MTTITVDRELLEKSANALENLLEYFNLYKTKYQPNGDVKNAENVIHDLLSALSDRSISWQPASVPLEYLTRTENGVLFRNAVSLPAHAISWAVSTPLRDDEFKEASYKLAARIASGVIPEAHADYPCRSDGRCQYAIDHGAGGLGHCPKGKCVENSNVESKYTTGHCKEKARPGGCQLHNLHCGYPECDRETKPDTQEILKDTIESFISRQQPIPSDIAAVMEDKWHTLYVEDDAEPVEEPGKWQAAALTLAQLGYTYHGGEQWKPPLGKQTLSQRMAAAGFTSRDTRLECEECGEKVTPQMLPIRKCKPQDTTLREKNATLKEKLDKAWARNDELLDEFVEVRRVLAELREASRQVLLFEPRVINGTRTHDDRDYAIEHLRTILGERMSDAMKLADDYARQSRLNNEYDNRDVRDKARNALETELHRLHSDNTALREAAQFMLDVWDDYDMKAMKIRPLTNSVDALRAVLEEMK